MMNLLKWGTSSSDALTPGGMSTGSANSKWLESRGLGAPVSSAAPFWSASGWRGRTNPEHPG